MLAELTLADAAEAGIRLARPEDDAAIHAVLVAGIFTLCRAAYGDAIVEAWAARRIPGLQDVIADGRFFVAETSGEVVAIGGWSPESPDLAWIRALFVAPPLAGHGLGPRILAEVERRAGGRGRTRFGARAGLNAVSFYARQGYREIERGPLELDTGLVMEHVLMWKGAR